VSRPLDHAGDIARLFGLGAVESAGDEPARGEQGRVWELRTARGRYAVKELLVPQKEASADADARVQERMLADGIPLPRPVRTVDGMVLAQVAGHALRVYEWVDLGGLDRALDPEAVGRLLAGIHAVVLPATGPLDDWYAAPVGAQTWNALVAEAHEAHAPFADELDALRDELAATEGLIVPPQRLQVCHRDLFADNVRPTPDGSLCVIDWENCGAADPSHELAVGLLEYTWGDSTRAAALHSAYLDAGGTGRVRERADFTMAIAQLGHILARSARLWLDATEPPPREHYGRAVAQFVAEPLTRDVIDRVLDAVS
jgi:Ser/Thr protein kinase RdoA (MazF antagonist)